MNIDKSVLCCDDVFRVSRFCLSRTTTTNNNNYSTKKKKKKKWEMKNPIKIIIGKKEFI